MSHDNFLRELHHFNGRKLENYIFGQISFVLFDKPRSKIDSKLIYVWSENETHPSKYDNAVSFANAIVLGE